MLNIGNKDLESSTIGLILGKDSTESKLEPTMSDKNR